MKTGSENHMTLSLVTNILGWSTKTKEGLEENATADRNWEVSVTVSSLILRTSWCSLSTGALHLNFLFLTNNILYYYILISVVSISVPSIKWCTS
jgi:hypothetical protein